MQFMQQLERTELDNAMGGEAHARERLKGRTDGRNELMDWQKKWGDSRGRQFVVKFAGSPSAPRAQNAGARGEKMPADPFSEVQNRRLEQRP